MFDALGLDTGYFEVGLYSPFLKVGYGRVQVRAQVHAPCVQLAWGIGSTLQTI